jgi:hypothetical protein
VTSLLRNSVDLVLGLVMTVGLSFAAFGLGSRFVSSMVGGLLGVGVFLSLLAWVLAGQLQDRRNAALVAGRCPRCGAALRNEHRHRRWDPSLQVWTTPSTTWDCDACSYGHVESWACPQCPQ